MIMTKKNEGGMVVLSLLRIVASNNKQQQDKLGKWQLVACISAVRKKEIRVIPKSICDSSTIHSVKNSCDFYTIF